MCGICGIIGELANKKNITKMNNILSHRGPDDKGTYIDKKNNVCLGHVRLAILELTKKGKQPMGYFIKNNSVSTSSLKDADYIITYNGEIYNYQELSHKYGIKMETHSDTEVLLKLYHLKGIKILRKLNGMWSFCIYDKIKNKIICSRDRIGKKPFYYYWDKKNFIFSSELKGILGIIKANTKNKIWKEAVELYFSLGFIPSPYTPFKNIKKLPQAYVLEYDLQESNIKTYKFWNLPAHTQSTNKKEIKKRIIQILNDAIKLRLRSDVPLGIFLSGGLDSTYIAYLLNKKFKMDIASFSMGFKEGLDESDNIKKIVDYLNLKHNHYYFEKSDFHKYLEVFDLCFDEPYGYGSPLPLLMLSEKAKQKVKVILSGDGGDEVFGGYNIYIYARWIDLLKKIPTIIRKILFLCLKGKRLYKIREGIRLSLINNEEIWNEAYKDILYKPDILKKWSKERMRYAQKLSDKSLSDTLRIFDLLYRTLGDNYLTKVDRTSMYYGLEVRCPFLDYRLLELSQKIPIEWKVGFFKGKKIYREIIKNVLPRKIVKGTKKGFNPPIEKWIIKENYVREIEDHLTILKNISHNLYEYYRNKVVPNKNKKWARIYLIRAYLFIRWWKNWIKD